MDKEKLEKIIKRSQRQFLAEKNEQINQMTRKLITFLNKEQEADYEVLHQFYHRLKRTAKTLELTEISLVAADIESMMLIERENLVSDTEHSSVLIKRTGALIDLIERRLDDSVAEDKEIKTSKEVFTEESVSSGKILIVNDDAHMLSFLEELLKNQGFDVYLTSNMKDASECLLNNNIDLTIIDIDKPEKSGFNIQNEINELKSDVPIILLMDSHSKELKGRAPSKASAMYCRKPVDSDDLMTSINGIITREKMAEIEKQKDELTQAFTRKHFAKRFEQEKEHLIKDHHPFSIAFLDIDDFKDINENQGQLFGNQMLIDFVEVIRNHSSDKSEIYRFSGDEFLLLFPGQSDEQAKNMIEKIRIAIQKTVFTVPDGTGEFKVTFSAGIAEFTDKKQSKTALLKKADRALYVAKENGKNQSVLASQTSHVSNNKVLVVDDEPLLTNIIKTRLGYLGYEVDYAKDGQEAVMKIEQHDYNLLLMDYSLPKVTGLEVLKRIKMNSEHANLKVIMILNKGSDSAVLESLKLGADDYFQKPFSLDVLEHKIRKILTY